MTTIINLLYVFTNGIGEKPYWKRNNGQITIYVADEQEFCTIPIHDNDELIAIAICEAGIILSKHIQETAKIKKALNTYGDHLPCCRSLINGLLKCNCGFDEALINTKGA